MANSSLGRTAALLVLNILITCGFITNNEIDEGQPFPEGFLLGVASSSYQIEGAWNQNGKGMNVWDKWTHEHPEVVIDYSNGDVACDAYNKYKEDIQILKNLGVDFYRFSLSWSRILPNGYTNKINHDGLQFYKKFIHELLANGIEPFVTLYHWDHPDVFESMGGWTNELMIDWISDYARIVFKELGPKVKYFIPINEPQIICEEAYMTGTFAEGKKLGLIGKYLCIHNILKAHARIYHIYDKEFRKEQNGQIGVSVPCNGMFPKTSNDIGAVDTLFQFECGIVAGPIYSKNGDYPEIVKERIAKNSKLEGYPKSILPKFSPEWVKYIKNTSDFFGLNHYTSRIVESVPRERGKPWYKYTGVKESINPSWPSSKSDWLKVVPEGFRQVINKITTEYDHIPIYVMENGFSDNGKISDNERIFYLYSYMNEMLSAIYKNGCNVKGYTVWSLLDNFEWTRGYTERFGIVNVDFEHLNRKRTSKSSLNWYKNVIQTRRLNNFWNLTYPMLMLCN